MIAATNHATIVIVAPMVFIKAWNWPALSPNELNQLVIPEISAKERKLK